MKTAAVLAIGNELLSGKTRDSNMHYLAQELHGLGVRLVLALFVPDEVDEIALGITYARKKADIVLTTGGVGPTHDDVTLRGLAQALDRELAPEPGLADAVRDYYGDRVNDEVLSMAEIPEGAELIQPAPFFLPIFRVENVYAFPGVPGALRLLFDPWKESIRQAPFHEAHFELDVDEGELAPLLTRTVAAHPDLEVGSYPRDDEGAPYRVLVTIEGKSLEWVQSAASALLPQLRSRFGDAALLRSAVPSPEATDANA